LRLRDSVLHDTLKSSGRNATLQLSPETVIKADWNKCRVTKLTGNQVARLENVVEAVGAGKKYQVRVFEETSVKPNTNAG
jgi:hypothetical protein